MEHIRSQFAILLSNYCNFLGIKIFSIYFWKKKKKMNSGLFSHFKSVKINRLQFAILLSNYCKFLEIKIFSLYFWKKEKKMNSHLWTLVKVWKLTLFAYYYSYALRGIFQEICVKYKIRKYFRQKSSQRFHRGNINLWLFQWPRESPGSWFPRNGLAGKIAFSTGAKPKTDIGNRPKISERDRRLNFRRNRINKIVQGRSVRLRSRHL